MWSRGLEGTWVSSGAAPTLHALSWGWWKPSMGGVKNVIPRMTYGKDPSLILVSGIVFCISQAIALSILLLIFNPLGSCDSSSLISLSWWTEAQKPCPGTGLSLCVDLALCSGHLLQSASHHFPAPSSLLPYFVFFKINLCYNLVSGTKSFMELVKQKWKWKLLSCVRLFVTLCEFSSPEYWSG